jgi:uncharacterized membrane protein YeiB
MTAGFQPVAIRDRIQTLDVVRGFALLGIALMNVEFFNRPIGELDLGMPAGTTGIDFWAGWFVHVFVRGKFWTMFSLLFGMGFAVMLTRADQAGRGFFVPYLRRTLALAVFGTLHFIFLWTGDILFSYACGAALLMLVFHARPRLLLWLGVAAVLLAAAFGAATAAGHALPWPPLLALGIPLLLFAFVGYAIRRWPVSGLRASGLALYLLPAMAMAIGGAAMMAQPPEGERDRVQLAAAKTPAQKEALTKALERRAEQRKEHAQDVADERRLMSQGSYAEATAWRARTFIKHLPQNAFFALILLGVFLLGAWFIRSGVMAEPAAHLPLFRKMAWIGIPLGVGLSLLSARISVTHVIGQNDAQFQLANGLAFVGNLPACIGYLSAVVLLFHGRGRSWLAHLAPVGRMALSNYILQSALGTLVFYGYGLGLWGLPRAQQVVYVLVVFALQVLLSRWWLARHRFGPLEWLWRWATYGQRPSLRLAVA